MTMVVTAPVRAASVRKVVSPGGIEAWLVEDHTNPLIAMQFAFPGGTSQDAAERPGVAYLLSGMLDEGAGPYESASFHEKVDDLAIELHFDTDRDVFMGSLKTLTRNGDEAFELLRLALAEPRFDEPDVERVKAQILAGLRREAKEPNAIARETFGASAFPNHPYGRPLKGTLETVPSIGRADLQELRRRTFARDGLKIAVVGDIDEARLGAALDRIFGGLAAKAELSAVADVELAGGPLKAIDLAGPQSVIVFGLPGLRRKDPDFVPAVVMNHILGGGSFTSRLWQEVRERRGLAYSVRSGLSPMRHGGTLTGSTSTMNERAAESISVITAEIANLAGSEVAKDELDKAKSFLTGSYGLRFDTSTKIARELLQVQLDELGIGYFARRNSEIAAVGAADIARVAKRLLDPKKMLVVVVGRPVGL